MRIIKSIQEMQDLAISLRSEGRTIGYVPTMGYLHEGHLSLVKEAKKTNDIVVMSIFINPLQFGPNEDFDQYPRDFERDERLARESGVDILFYPTVKDMYPATLSISLTVEKRTNVLCGKSRPGHFDGVATVVMKLFNIVLPARAYFGMKDAQQVAVVIGMVTDFNIPVEIVPVPTVREKDGLAKSSRNIRLSAKERLEAPVIYKSLNEAKVKVLQGEKDTGKLKEFIRNRISNYTSSIDYVEILSYPNLTEPSFKKNEKIIIAIAVRFSAVRLIDNLLITIDE